MRDMLARVLGRNTGGWDYVPRQWGASALDEVDAPGPLMIEASQHYFNATLDYAMSAQEFRSIRIDLSHKVRLINSGRNVIANRAHRHRNEPVYTVAVRWCVASATNGAKSYSSVRLMAMLASDYDHIMDKAGMVAVG